MKEIRNVSIMVIGETGTGKSQFGDAYLMKKAFDASSLPESCSPKTISCNNIINDTCFHYIDNPGFFSSDNLDSLHTLEMVEFLKKWKIGINAFFIMLNIQCPRFSQSTKQMIRFFNEFFNDPNFWTQTGIIFTHCYEGYFDRKTGENHYRSAILNFIQTFPGCEKLNLPLPCFFVDSYEWETNLSVQQECQRIRNFASQFLPIPTQKMKLCSPGFKIIEKKIINKKLVNVSRQKDEFKELIIYHYEDQEINKLVGYNGEIRYSHPVTIRKYTEKTEIDLNQSDRVVRICETSNNECLIY